MTTDAAWLAQLQTAWNQTADLPAPGPPADQDAAGLRLCSIHSDPRNWLDEPARSRPGWIRTTCRRCGGVIGYRPGKEQRRRSRLDDKG